MRASISVGGVVIDVLLSMAKEKIKNKNKNTMS
jgi:hypothetical protein